MTTWTRRDFLKFSSAALAMAWLGPVPPDDTQPAKPIGLGRVTEPLIWVYTDARPDADRVQSLPRDTVVEIYDSISMQGLLAHNPVWNLTRAGWVYSSWVQPVARQINPIVRAVPESGFWAQVSVPFVEMRSKPADQAPRLYRLYYSSVHLVIAQVQDPSGQAWYQLRDDQWPNRLEYVRAEGLRPIAPEEISPLAHTTRNKSIEVSLADQMVHAFEDETPVFSTRCATGAAFRIENIGLADFRTPVGEHTVIRKRPSRHMLGFLDRADAYDLPGVPFVTYFTASGVAIHGTYWHNDYGRPRSHGCVNVTPEAAQWFYRWTQPAAAYEDAVLEVKNGGTPIVVA
jgi:lipoprotein-anchoring transpeptidase ErfK/SrfK